MYDSRYHGIQCARQVVQSGGVINAIPIEADAARAMFIFRLCTKPQGIPTRTIEIPIIFNTSTRHRSVEGAHGCPKQYSCTRKTRPSAKISAPRRIIRLPMTLALAPLRRMRSVTNAEE